MFYYIYIFIYAVDKFRYSHVYNIHVREPLTEQARVPILMTLATGEAEHEAPENACGPPNYLVGRAEEDEAHAGCSNLAIPEKNL